MNMQGNAIENMKFQEKQTNRTVSIALTKFPGLGDIVAESYLEGLQIRTSQGARKRDVGT